MPISATLHCSYWHGCQLKLFILAWRVVEIVHQESLIITLYSADTHDTVRNEDGAEKYVNN